MLLSYGFMCLCSFLATVLYGYSKGWGLGHKDPCMLWPERGSNFRILESKYLLYSVHGPSGFVLTTCVGF